jgi:hypothetical protein
VGCADGMGGFTGGSWEEAAGGGGVGGAEGEV